MSDNTRKKERRIIVTSYTNGKKKKIWYLNDTIYHVTLMQLMDTATAGNVYHAVSITVCCVYD